MCSYIVSEYSTMFPLQLHMQSTSSWCLQVIFPLISNIGSTQHTQKSISDSECWMVIGWCKKLTKGQLADQSHGPLINGCFAPKTP